MPPQQHVEVRRTVRKPHLFRVADMQRLVADPNEILLKLEILHHRRLLAGELIHGLEVVAFVELSRIVKG